MIEVIQPNWDIPDKIHAFTTTRLGGVSISPYDSLNLGNHVGDETASVTQNRALLKQRYLPSEPLYLSQTHSDIVINSKDYIYDIKAMKRSE